MGFKTTLITNLFHLKQGTYLSPSQMKKSQSQEFCYPVYGANGVIGFSNRKMYSERTTLVSCRGANCGVIHYTKPNAWISNNSIACIPKSEADPTFYYYLCSNSIFNDVITGAAQPQITITNLSSKKLIHPPLPTQKKIAGILSAYDDAIENNLRRIKLLEEMAQITYEEWFVRLRFPGHTTTPINEATGLPEGWKKKQIKDIGEVVTGKTPSTTNQDFFGDEVPFIKTPDMADAPYVISTTQSLSRLGANSQKNKYLPKNSLMVSCIGTVGSTGLVAVASQTNQQINSIVFKDSTYCFFMYCFSRGLKPLLEGLGSNGATMTNVNKKKFEGIEFDCPAKDILVSYNAKVSSNFESILNLQYQNQHLREARDILLPRLMTGVIDAEKYQPENFLKKN